MERRIFLIVGLDSTLNGISNVAPKTYQTILTSFSATSVASSTGHSN